MQNCLEEVRHLCNTGNQYLELRNTYELVVTSLSEEQQSRLRKMGCSYDYLQKNKFFIVRVPKREPSRSFTWAWMILFLALGVGYIFRAHLEEIGYFLEDQFL